MVINNNVNNIARMIPNNTKLVRFNTESDGSISEVEVSNLTDAQQNDIMACNMVLQAYLTCFGIDIASMARNNVDVSDYRLIDMRNLLSNAKWETVDITIDNVTKTALEWIAYRFQIYNKKDFVNSLFLKLNDAIMRSQATEEGNMISIDIDTYLMIKLIALAYGADITFTEEKIGQDTITNIEFDPNNLTKFKQDLASILVSKGYIDSSITSVSFHSYQDTDVLGRLLTPVTELNGQWGNLNGEYHYAHIMICLNSDTSPRDYSDHFAGMLYFTKVPIDDFDCTYINGTYGAEYAPVVKVYNSEQQLETYNLKDRFIQIPIHDTTIGTNNQPFINSEIGHEAYQAKAKDLDWNVNIGGQEWREFCPFYQASVANASSEWILENNIGLELAPTVPQPTTDTTIYNYIDNIDLLQIKNKYPIVIGVMSIVQLFKELATPFDIEDTLHTSIIDVNRKVNLRTGVPYSNIKQDENVEYSSRFKCAIPYTQNFMGFIRNPFEWTFVCDNDDSINSLSNKLWSQDFIKKLIDNIAGLKPLDCMKNIIHLPFKLNDGTDKYLKGRDYDPELVHPMMGGFAIPEVNAHNLERYIKILNSKPIAIGFKVEHQYQYGMGATFKEIYKGDDDTYLNYEPYSKASIYIPFIGERELDMSLIMHKYIYLEYIVYIPTGDFIATVRAYDFDETCDVDVSADYEGKFSMQKAYPILVANGNMALSYSIAGREQSNAIGGLVGAVGGALGTVATGGVGAIASGVNAVNSALSTINGNTRVGGTSMGNITSNMYNLTPYVTLYSHECIKGYKEEGENSAFRQTVGMVSQRGLKIANMTNGYHRVKKGSNGVFLQGLKCTAKEQETLLQILENGFYV